MEGSPTVSRCVMEAKVVVSPNYDHKGGVSSPCLKPEDSTPLVNLNAGTRVTLFRAVVNALSSERTMCGGNLSVVEFVSDVSGVAVVAMCQR